ncbi:hypothetical protein [Streptomyces sp. NPDC001914]|uniref:hypothetical protein n=1 Tax=Streptomyces sp. NPDC001914 TaxID=3364623 RepID=UPI0036C7C74A
MHPSGCLSIHLRRGDDPAQPLLAGRLAQRFEPQNPQKLNRYSSAANNPATFTDSIGMSYDDIIGAIGALIGGIVGVVLGVAGAVFGASWGTASISSPR